MNIDLNFTDSFPSIEKLTKDNVLYIQINNEKYNLKTLIDTKKTVQLKNIQNEIILKILIKEQIIIGINTFDPKIFIDIFLTNPKPIYHWLDFKQEKNNYINNKNNINYFLYEYIRLKIKIAPTSKEEMTNKKKMINTKNNINSINNNNNSRKNSKKQTQKINENGKKSDIPAKNDFFKNKIFKTKNYNISLKYMPGVVKNASFFSMRNFAPLNKAKNSQKMNKSLSSKQNISSETYYTNYNKQFNMIKKSSKDNSFNHRQLESNRINLFGEDLLLNNDEDFIYIKDSNRNTIMDWNYLIKNETTKNAKIKVNNNNEMILYKDYENTKINSNRFKIMNSSYSDEINQFNILKNDFDLFYTQNFIKNIKNDDIFDEFYQFLQKIISLFIFYRNTASLLFYENKNILNNLNNYRIILKSIKKKINKLTILKDDNELKLKHLEIAKESSSKVVESINSQKNFNQEIIQKVFIINKNKEMMKIIKNLINKNLQSISLTNNNQKNKTDNNINNKINIDEKMQLLSSRNKKYKTINDEDCYKSVKSKIINNSAYINKRVRKLKQVNSFVINSNTKNINNKNAIKDLNIKKSEKQMVTKFKTTKFKTNKNTPKNCINKIQSKK